MSRALVAIGISKAPPLEELPGAVTDAKYIADYARTYGYQHVHVFTDEDGRPIRAHSIFEHCKSLLALPDLEQLVIFFSGHGYSPLPGHEFWLLSEWDSDANEAINASTSVQAAQRFERPRISFIADACRVTWNAAQCTAGLVILPKAKPPSSNSQVDEFYASAFGDVSQQYEPAQTRASYGVFSREILNALKGAAAIDRQGKRVVTSRSLEDYLAVSVPNSCAQIPNAAVQHPDTHAKWREPNNVYVEFAGPTRPLVQPPPGPSNTPPKVDQARARRYNQISEDARRYQAAEGRESYETATGITIIGAKVENVVISSGHTELLLEDDAWQIRVCGDMPLQAPHDPSTVLIQISNDSWPGYWVAVPAFPELVATAVIDEYGFSSLNYRTARRFRSEQEYLSQGQIEAALAQAAAMFRYGMMPSFAGVGGMIALMRDHKYDNPALAIVAAHICHRLGDFEQITDMEKYEIGRGLYTPYDLVLLSGHEKPAGGRKLVGTFPFLSRGWGLLSAAEFQFDKRLLRVVGGLTPSLWTMANPDAGTILAELVSPAAQRRDQDSQGNSAAMRSRSSPSVIIDRRWAVRNLGFDPIATPRQPQPSRLLRPRYRPATRIYRERSSISIPRRRREGSSWRSRPQPGSHDTRTCHGRRDSRRKPAKRPAGAQAVHFQRPMCWWSHGQLMKVMHSVA